MTAKEGNGKAAFEAGREGGKGTGSGGGKRIKTAAGGRARRVPRNKDMQIRKSSHMSMSGKRTGCRPLSTVDHSPDPSKGELADTW